LPPNDQALPAAPLPLHFQPTLRQPLDEQEPHGEMSSGTDNGDGGSWRTVDDDNEGDDGDDSHNDDYQPNYDVDLDGMDIAAAPRFYDHHNLQADARPIRHYVAHPVGIEPHNHGPLDNAVNADDIDNQHNAEADVRGDVNDEDEWEVEDWNEGMREGWDWVPLAVVFTCFVVIFGIAAAF
jgi:hypothetical protein